MLLGVRVDLTIVQKKKKKGKPETTGNYTEPIRIPYAYFATSTKVTNDLQKTH